MKRTTPIVAIGGSLIALSIFCTPLSAMAASINANVSASSINSLGKFRVTMTATGVTACTWSRLDNGTTWQWKDQPLPGTAYDSGEISGWAGAAEYEWQFNCDDGMGGSVFGATSITISANNSSNIFSSSFTSFIAAIITSTPNPNPPSNPAILVLPNPLVYPDTLTDGTYNDIHLTVTNTGDAGSLLTGSVSIVGDPAFTCFSGCTYTNISPGAGPEVIIRFTPTTEGPKTATMQFSGGGGTSIPASGTGVTPTPIPLIVATPQPVIDIAPAYTLVFYGVEMGNYRDKQFIVRNVGQMGTLLTGSVSIVNDADFSCYSGCSYNNLDTTNTHIVTIRFRPASTPGTKLGVVGFSGGGNATRYLNGEGYISSITGSLDFQNVIVNSTKIMAFTVTNPSSFTNAGVGTIIVPLPFWCSSGCVYNLPPGGSHTFTITYTPTTPGPNSEVGGLSGYTSSQFNFIGNGVPRFFHIEEQ